jgi:hypothetical protein
VTLSLARAGAGAEISDIGAAAGRLIRCPGSARLPGSLATTVVKVYFQPDAQISPRPSRR